MIPNYVCTRCGRGFASARSARRHVKNIEANNAYVVTEADYRISLITGRLPAPAPKSIRSKTNFDLSKMAAEEFMRAFFRRLGERKADRLDPKLEEDMVILIDWQNMLNMIKQGSL